MAGLPAVVKGARTGIDAAVKERELWKTRRRGPLRNVLVTGQLAHAGRASVEIAAADHRSKTLHDNSYVS
jgi:hypothetical protein